MQGGTGVGRSGSGLGAGLTSTCGEMFQTSCGSSGCCEPRLGLPRIALGPCTVFGGDGWVLVEGGTFGDSMARGGGPRWVASVCYSCGGRLVSESTLKGLRAGRLMVGEL